MSNSAGKKESADTPLFLFNKQLMRAIIIGIAVVLVTVISFMAGITSSTTTLVICLGVFVVFTWWRRANYVNYLSGLSKASESDIDKDYVSIQRSPLAWVFLSSLLALFLYRYLKSVPLAVGCGLVYFLYAWQTKEKRIAKVLRGKRDPIRFEASKKATVVGFALLMAAGIIYESLNLSYTQGLILVSLAVFSGVVYYFILTLGKTTPR